MTKNCVISARAPPSKLVYIGAEGAFTTILGSVKIGQNSSKGDIFGWQGVESLMGGVPPKSAPDLRYLALLSDVSTLLVEWKGKKLFR